MVIEAMSVYYCCTASAPVSRIKTFRVMCMAVMIAMRTDRKAVRLEVRYHKGESLM